MKQDFMLIGASKCATSTISTLLAQHPQIHMVSKESQFFCNDSVYQNGVDWYERQFDGAELGQAIGDRNNLYSMKEVFPDTVRRIHAYNPDLKLIYCVRHPLRRIESYWVQIRSHGGEELHHDFNRSVRLNCDWLVDASNYWQQLEPYRQHFSDEQFHVVFFEDYKANPTDTLASCFQFLGVDPTIQVSAANLHLNPSQGKIVPRQFLSVLRTQSWFRAVIQLIPQSLRDPIKQQLCFRQMSGRPTWNRNELEWVCDSLQADTQRFLEFFGKPTDYWSFEPAATVRQNRNGTTGDTSVAARPDWVKNAAS
ncbi:MAG: sulfotransferase domain-containing protein [Synechococcus sp.]